MLMESGINNCRIPMIRLDQLEGNAPNEDVIEETQWTRDEAAMEDLSFITFGAQEGSNTEGCVEVAWTHWSNNCQTTDCDDSKIQIEAAHHLNNSDGPSLYFGQLKQASTVSTTKIMGLMTLQLESGYYSNINRVGEVLQFDAYYNLQGDREPQIEGDTVIYKFKWQSLTFSYNMFTGRASYLLACSDENFEAYKKAVGDRRLPAGRRPHPFSLHLILLFKGILARSEQLEETLRRLLSYEDQIIYRRTKVTFESGDATKLRLQELHSLFKDLLIHANTNKRYMASVNSLVRDLDRLQKTTKSTAGTFPIDDHDHRRMSDGFHCLKSFCLDRERRIETRLRRVQNLIALTYNLLANRDSITAQKIAQEARQDGAAMKTIALVTMLFFPATFVSSFLGTNLVALEAGADGRTRFVVSHLWWIYLVSAVPLTITTLLAWLYFVKRRSRKERAKWQRIGEANA
ncbi:MAG: hypothetical protein LQ349_003311 [Xanthoria aureola]|nr:MAG: hypothetical protein LQ349_003311 [Xanthoria aureola]